MPIYLLDTSALVKRYFAEMGSSWVMALSNPLAGNSLYLAEITPIEVVAAITRRARGSSLTSADALTALTAFEIDLTAQYLPVSITPALLAVAMRMVKTYALRGYDAVQLASALEIHGQHIAAGLPAVTLVSADTDLNAAAIAEGLVVEDPNTHP